MKYVCIDDGAVSELISGREYQSIDFAEGAKLIEALSGKVQFVARLGKVALFQDSEGAFLTTGVRWKSKNYLIIDCEQSALFTQLGDSDSLTSFQKLLRFCSKYWGNGIYNNSEKLIKGSTKAIIFPLPYTDSAPYRVAIEREPSKNRLQKRGMGGRFLLVYKSGRESADSSVEHPNETNFRKAFERLPEIYKIVENAVTGIEQSLDDRQMASTKLQSTPSSPRSLHQPFSDWLSFLTEQQQKFVFAAATTPHRLQGPAGTGKTLSLIMRTLRVLMDAERKGEPCHALLLTHSEATRESIQNALSAIDKSDFSSRTRGKDDVTLSVATLASLCADHLRQVISETEFIDRDAQDSKFLQRLYIEQAISDASASDLPSFKQHLSETFLSLFAKQTDELLAPLFQHEISVQIKGRAGESFDIYKNCPPLKYGLPIETDADKGFVFSVYRGYQRQLAEASQFDTDDVVISAVGQLDTPIWRRRREREGYDLIAIDETHLFNINELHVFHHFTRGVGKYPISFTVDQAQAVGDRGWDDDQMFADLNGKKGFREETTTVSAVFRNSPDIREFCHTILASGATLFTNFDNTLSASQSAFTAEDERRAQRVRYIEFADDKAMIEGAFQRASALQSDTETAKSQILITTLSDELIIQLRKFAEEANKPVTFIERRGDYTQVKKAESSGHFVLGHVDFVGGLEFDAVVVVGVDKGRVPFEGITEDSNSRSFMSYVAHNRLYVACSRARYALNLLGNKSRGPSQLLHGAAINGIIDGINR